MELKNKIAVVTGGARGIGRALCRRFAAEGAEAVVVVDRDFDQADQVAREINGLGLPCDVGNEVEVRSVVRRTIEAYGRIDLFCSNAGIAVGGGLEATDDQWQRSWEVNFLSQLYAARAVIPVMLERGSGYLLQTASAAGLLTEMGSAPYSVSKHAAVSFAEWLSIHYRDQGIGVSCLCPMGVETDMLLADNPHVAYLRYTSVTAEHVAETVIQGLASEKFLILPHPEVHDFFRHKADDYDRWLRGMRRLDRKITGGS
ncbi:MAG: SDR family oxidoreductase [Planctomycetaceae bacterium]